MPIASGLTINTRNLGEGAGLLARRRRPIGVLRISSGDGDAMPAELCTRLREKLILWTVSRVEVEDIDLGTAGLKALTTSRYLSRVRELALLDCDWQSKLGAEVGAAIAKSRSLSKLRSLELAVINLGPAGMTALANSDGLRALRRLRIASCGIGDDGLQALCESELWPQLEELFLDSNDITDAGVDALVQRAIPERLSKIHVRDGALSPRSTAALALTFGARVADAADWWL